MICYKSTTWIIEQITVVANYITNEIKKKHQTGELHYRVQIHQKIEDLENEYLLLESIIQFKIPNAFISIPHNLEIKTFSNLETRHLRQVLTLDGTKVKIEKYKNIRKTETIVFELSTLQNLNTSFQETFLKFLQKNQEAKEPASPEFGSSKPIEPVVKPKKLAGNDGISQSAVMRKVPKMTIELKPYTLQEVAEHRTEQDAWMAINGKVYDVTFYVRFHPGGKEKLMLGVGIDGTALFNQYHSWVNAHFLLEKYQVGLLVHRK